MAGLQDILFALSTGGAPVGNRGRDGLPLLAGLGAQQAYMQQATPAERTQVSPQAQVAMAPQGQPPGDTALQTAVLSALAGSLGLPPQLGAVGAQLLR